MEKGNISSIQIRKKIENIPIRKKENIQIGKRKIFQTFQITILETKIFPLENR